MGETDYYPFGLIQQGISSRAAGSLENKRKWNSGSELNTDFDINLYETFYRNVDPQIGRFWQVDPEAEAQENLSPYHSMENNPISNVDPFGDFASRFGAWLHKLLHGGGKIERNEYGEWSVNKSKVETSVNEDGGVTATVTAYKYYGAGRNKYTAAIKEIENDQRVMMDIQMNGDKSMYQMYDSPKEAGLGALSIGTGLVLPNAVIKPINIKINVPKIANTMAGKTIQELRAMVGGKNAELLRKLFGTNEKGAKTVLDNIENVKIPEGLTKETLEAYRELINRVPDPRGTQAVRAQILDALLKK